MFFQKRATNSTCLTGGFFKSPVSSQHYNTSTPLNITWDNSCLNVSQIDIYLYAPQLTSPLIHMWQGVDFKSGSYPASLSPKWWNNSQTVELSLKVVGTGQQIFQSTIPPSLNFNVTKTTNATNSPLDNSSVTQVNGNASKSHHGPSKGGIAAAVLLTLIFVGLAIAGYIKFSRNRQAEKRRRFSQNLDKRMSTISKEWSSISVVGAEAAIRQSMAISQYRSSFTGGGGAAGVGTNAANNRSSSADPVEGDFLDLGDNEAAEDEKSSHVRRPGVGPRGLSSNSNGAERVSRVSFAADTRFSRSSTYLADGRPSTDSRTRPSLDSRRPGVASRAFHTSEVPPIPALPSHHPNERHTKSSSSGSNSNRNRDNDDGEGVLSPRQTSGPLSLTSEDIIARMNHDEGSSPRPSIDEVLPALSMMRTGTNPNASSTADLLLNPITPPPAAATTNNNSAIAKSPIMDSMPMHSMQNAMSPDDMVKAYALQRKNSMPASPMGYPPTPTYPAAAHQSDESGYTRPGMRSLYPPSPMTPNTPAEVSYPANDAYDSYYEIEQEGHEEDSYVH